MHARDIAWKGVDFGPLLPEGVTLSGEPTLTLSPTVGLDYSQEQVNDSEFADADDGQVAIVAGEGVVALFAPTRHGRYRVTVECDTSDDQHLAVDFLIHVDGD